MSTTSEQALIQENKYIALHEQFSKAIYIADDIVTKNYLARLTDMDVVEPDAKSFVENKKDVVRLIRIDEMVYCKDEYATHKFASVFGAMTTIENSVFLLIDSDGEKARFYMGVRCDDSRREADTQLTTLRNSLQAQFPGIKATENTEYKNPDIVDLIKGIKPGSISSVSCIANLRDEETRDNKTFLQGLEKFALSQQGKKYTAIILANSLPQDKIAEVRHMYEQIYTQLAPYAGQQLAYGTNESWNTSTTDAEGKSEGYNFAVGHSINHGTTISENTGESTATSQDNTASRVLGALGAVSGIAVTAIGAVATAATGGAATPITAPLIAAGGMAAAGGIGAVLLRKTTTTATNVNRGVAENHAEGENINIAENKAHNINHAETSGQSGGSTYNLTLTTKNKTVLSLMERIDNQLKRMREFESYGMWECSTYIISSEPNISEMAASTYKAIMSGEHTGVEISTVNTWRHDSPHNDKIHKYITNFMQPLFRYRGGGQTLLDVTAGTFVSGKELALHMGLPRRSVPGFRVIEHAEFAQEISGYEKSDDKNCFVIGKIYSMGRVNDNTDARLDVNSLTMHTFITGSTGSGKSNAVCTLLDKLCLSTNTDKAPRFLVIEPAKGEYKYKIGGYKDVFVYGTNQSKTSLLRLNPFSFLDDIHVLEHIDRLIEIFNACWPMYAAMPAVLKAAVEKAYINMGWSLTTSTCLGMEHHNKRFPTFRDVMKALPEVIDSKGFSEDTQGDYKGALLTRVESLTNGINGQVLCAYNELTVEELFEENVIVDLSRVGSMETKALLMGILILKLQEYRMVQRSGGKNCSKSRLSHVTVLEEAHNLLRRTSSEQTQDSSNLQGKSVEMLANAIAELRSFGEGFIIADQAPGLLDMAVIRNTNTKIIMRLPDEGDRQLVGKAAGLNDDQIAELSKLETGVAAVYQNEWLEPILCKVEEFTDSKVRQYDYQQPIDEEKKLREVYLQNLITSSDEARSFSGDEIDRIKRWIESLDTGAKAKDILYRGIQKKLSATQKGYALYCVIKGDILFERTKLKRNKGTTAIIMDILNVDQVTASEVRRIVCDFAAKQVRDDEVYYNALRQYGSVM